VQVLVSVQAMVFVNDPYFNEPNVEQMRHQAEGISASKQLNAVLAINTVQWAMIDVLRHPKPGFEAAITAHFKTLRHVILQHCQKWLQDMDLPGEQGQLNQERMAGVIMELNGLLNKL
jgi:baculoviral IAP repeat-containing protein 6 (apollon)